MSHTPAVNFEDTAIFETLASGSSVVAMVQSSHASPRNHLTAPEGSGPASWGSFTQPEMGAVVMVVRDILREKPLQMSFRSAE